MSIICSCSLLGTGKRTFFLVANDSSLFQSVFCAFSCNIMDGIVMKIVLFLMLISAINCELCNCGEGNATNSNRSTHKFLESVYLPADYDRKVSQTLVVFKIDFPTAFPPANPRSGDDDASHVPPGGSP